MAGNSGGARLEPRPAPTLNANPIQPIVSATGGISKPALKPPIKVYAIGDSYDTSLWFIIQSSSQLDLLDGAPGKFHPESRQWEVLKAHGAICIARFLEAGVYVEVINAYSSETHYPPPRRALAGVR